MYHIVEGQRALVNQDGYGIADLTLQGKPASPRYFVTDPYELADKLRGSGCFGEIEVKELGRKKTRGWRHAVVAHEPAWVGDTVRPEYIGNVSVFLDHTGKKPDMIRPGAIRVACENQFLGELMRFHHCRQEIRDFWIDPIPYLRAAIATGSRQVIADLESLRLVGDGRELLKLVDAATPRLGKRLYNAYVASPGRGDFYQVLQGCTRSRSPGLSVAATEVLTAGYCQASRGIVPDCWRARFAVPVEATILTGGSTA